MLKHAENIADEVTFFDSKAKGYQNDGKKISKWVYSYTCYSIQEICKMNFDEGGNSIVTMAPYMSMNVDGVLRYFAKNYFRSDDEEKVQAITKMIVAQHRFRRLSLFGLIHCLNLIVAGEEGFEGELYGFDAMKITRLINKYLGICKDKHRDWVDANTEKVGNRERWGRIASSMPDEIREKINELQRKLEAENGGSGGDDFERRLKQNIAEDLKKGY